MAGMAEATFGEGECLGRRYGEDQDGLAVVMAKSAIATTHCHRPSHFFAHALARRSSRRSSVMWTATPSTTTSMPCSQRLQPVVKITCGLERMFRAFCLFSPSDEMDGSVEPQRHRAA